MNSHTLQSTDQHRQISSLLPWYSTHNLEPTERLKVENHIRGCMLCRRELVQLGRLAAAVKQAPDLDIAAETSFDKLRAKLQAPIRTSEPFKAPHAEINPESATGRDLGLTANNKPRHKPFWDFFLTQGAMLAIAASVFAAVIPIAMLYGLSPAANYSYQTLSDAKPDSGVGLHLRVVFSKSISDTDMNALLAKIHGERVEGPNSVGAYTVRLDSDEESLDMASAIAFLREQQDVILAEPVVSQP